MKDEASAAVARPKPQCPADKWDQERAELQDRIFGLKMRAEAAEAKVAAAEERGLIFNTLPDGRLDFCAIREGSRLWEDKVRTERAEAREAALREALEKIADEQKVYLGHGDYTIEPAYSAEEAQGMAREALAAAAPTDENGCYTAPDGSCVSSGPCIHSPASTTPVIPRLNIRCETTNGHAIGSTYLNVVRVEAEDDGSFTAVTDHWPAPPPASNLY